MLAQRKDSIQEPYPVEPVALCVEILSPSDAMSEILVKCEAYHAWGVAVTWIIDPDEQRAWIYAKGERPKEATSALKADGFEISVAEIFSILNN